MSDVTKVQFNSIREAEAYFKTRTMLKIMALACLRETGEYTCKIAGRKHHFSLLPDIQPD